MLSLRRTCQQSFRHLYRQLASGHIKYGQSKGWRLSKIQRSRLSIIKPNKGNQHDHS